jgi:hypothetical protein
MSGAEPLRRLAVGVVVERRRATSRWGDMIWRPVAVLGGLPEAAPWTALSDGGDATIYYAGPADIELHRAETDGYRRNLLSGAPSIWVALQPTGGDPPYAIACVTADPAEGESLTEAGQAIVEAVAMPEPLRDAVAAFIAEHHVERGFEKRRRDRADPEAMARRAPRTGGEHE